MTDDVTALRQTLLDDLASPLDGEIESLLARGLRARRRRRTTIAGSCLASVCVAAGFTGLALSAMQTPSHPRTTVQAHAPERCAPIACLPGLIMARGPDPTTGRPFPTAAAASAAAGRFYVPNCPGHGTYYVQANGSVVTFFNGRDTMLSASPPHSGSIVGPIPGNALVTPQQLTAQGQVAYGYEATPRVVHVAPNKTEAVLVHSYLTWVYRGSAMRLSSVAELSLSDLKHLADSCR